MEEQIDQSKFAVLIDGDNAQASLLPQILAEVSKVGLITIKRIFGDWTTTNMNSWKEPLHQYAIQPVQQFRYTVGKNATDSAMIIDAMDILHSGDVDGFCIVSSDSDYTRLATRIRESGLFVIGIGEKKTPKAFANACNQFIYCENLVPAKELKKSGKKAKNNDMPKTPNPLPLLIKGFEMAAKDEEWVHLSEMGMALRRLDPAFDPRTFGYQRLQLLIKNYPETFNLKIDDSKQPPISYLAMVAETSVD
jgi:uncharacterized LabA/DUF88 family protein